MYPYPFKYVRPKSLGEAATLLSELGEEARLLAGGQSLIPLMKFRFAAPSHLVDLNFIPNLSFIDAQPDSIRLGPLVRHADVEASTEAKEIPIVGDCAGGIADVQVRNRGTVAGSIAEADPSGDWVPVLLTLDTSIQVVGPSGERQISLRDLIVDAYTTTLAADEIVSEIRISRPGAGSGGAYVAFKRCAQVYASAAAAAQLTMSDGTCTAAGLYLGSVGLTAIHAAAAEQELVGTEVKPAHIARAAEAAAAACDPQSDKRGSADYKRALVRTLVERATEFALRRCRGEQVEVSHYYA